MFCRKCGAQISENAKFCPKCGTEVRVEQMNEPEIEPEKRESEEQQHTGKGFVGVVVFLVVIIVASLAIIGYIVWNNSKGREILAQNETETFLQTSEEANETIKCNYTIICNDAIYASPVEGVMCSFTPVERGLTVYGTSDAEGNCNMKLEAGQYLLNTHKEGYYDENYTINVTDDGAWSQVNLIAGLDDSRLLILVEWAGDSDVDIGMFNAQTNTFIDCKNVYDTSGSFLYADHDASYGYELFSYNNDEGVYNFFVRDYSAMAQGVESTMLSDGVRIKVYSLAGLIYTLDGNPDMNTPVWNPFYLYNGQIESLDSYDFDYTAIDGLMTDKNQ